LGVGTKLPGMDIGFISGISKDSSFLPCTYEAYIFYDSKAKSGLLLSRDSWSFNYGGGLLIDILLFTFTLTLLFFFGFDSDEGPPCSKLSLEIKL